ncbi:MAG: hypothetical protein JSV49_09470 [Thermoplasmata archaeon]|nr:MAG: hypothetical protein JSV49_09470 [Thermoplasmata archaeon]
MSAIAKRLEYERELIQIIESKTNFFGQRGTHSQGIDVLLFKTSGLDGYSFCVRGEVKTSGSHKINMSGKVHEQYDRYLEVWKDRRVMTFYFYRLLTSKQYYPHKSNNNSEFEVTKFRQGHKEDKWLVFRIDQLPKNRNGKPYLDFFDQTAMTMDDFIDLLK